MGMGEQLNNNVKSWTVLAMTIVVALIVLVKFKAVEGGACVSGYTFNSSTNNCLLDTNVSQNVAINTAGSTIDLFVTGLSEPANWVAIVIIALIGFAIIKLVNKK